jgi:nicotinamide-nucleotide amidase
MNAAIIVVGSELLEPGRTDTNSAYLIEKLASIGIPVVWLLRVGDDRAHIAEAARLASARADVVVATGGLGPTSDDTTREGFADAMDLELALDEEVMEQIRHRFAKRGYRMPEVNRRQAMVPAGAKVLPNRGGTAPGLWLTWAASGKTRSEVILLPGPPREVKTVFEEHVLPELEGRGGDWVYRRRRLHVAGLTESAVEEAIGHLYRKRDNPRTAILASAGQIEIHLTARSRHPSGAEDLLDELAGRIRAALGQHVFSELGETLEQVLGRLLLKAGKTVSVAESCTGGLISHRLTDVPGSSAYFERGYVTYSNESKVELLGVPMDLILSHGAVSEQVARSMATGARERGRSDIALAVTGIAGPGGGSVDKPVGLVFIAVADEKGETVERYRLPGGRSRIKLWTSQLALNMLRLRLLERNGEKCAHS